VAPRAGVAPAACGALLAALAFGAPPPRDALPEVLPVAAEVKDPVFAILVGLIRADTHGTLSGERLARELARHPGRTRLPYQRLRELRREATAPATARVTAVFDGPLDLPIPYRILWYNPGRFTTAATCRFEEWSLGDVRVTTADGTRAALAEVRVFGLAHGQVAGGISGGISESRGARAVEGRDSDISVDVDGWIDRLLGASLDDTRITGLLLLRHAGRPYAMAVGYNRQGHGRSGAFDLAADRIVFPVPGALRAAGRELRARMEALLRGA